MYAPECPPGSQRDSADPVGESVDHLRRFMRAASVAIDVYPGPVGELLRREIFTHLELGYRILDANALIPRIVDDILESPWDEPGPREAPGTSPSAPAPPRRGPGPRAAYRVEACCFEG